MTRFIAFGAVFLLACSGAGGADAADDCFTCGGKADELGVSEGSCEAAALLDFVSSADFDTLDVQVGLDSRAAEGIVAHGPFSSLAELDAVFFVGPRAFEKLTDYASNEGLLSCEALALTEGEPNTEFLETFLFLQDEATGDCIPFGGAYTYESARVPDDTEVAQAVAELSTQHEPSATATIQTALSREIDFAPFLSSFDFSLEGLHSAIGADDYHLASATIEFADRSDQVMVLHYRDHAEVWTVTLSCQK